MTSMIGYPKDFLDSMDWLKPIEGGYWPGGKTDPNPTNRGITQKTLDGVRKSLDIDSTSVTTLTQDEADLIYFKEYWTPAGCWRLVFPLYLIVFDTAVNCGVGNALSILHRTSDPKSYLIIRAQYYLQVSILHPDLAPNLPGWRNRIAKLRKRCSLS